MTEIMKTTNLYNGGGAYFSPEVRVLNLGSENGFASSGLSGKWNDAGNSSADLTIGSDYNGEFE